MKHLIRNYQMILAILVISSLFACQKDDQPTSADTTYYPDAALKSQGDKIFYGPSVPIGHGVARAWISQDISGNPTAVGINLTEKALESLPDQPSSWVLFFPNHGATDFYTHVLVDWNPQGHEPPGVYDQPHFDFHFYIISNEERLMIGPDDTLQFANAPAGQYVPPAYLQIPGGVPQMGAHWVDLLAPEFNGGDFTRTFIWGSYDGEFIFWEPMITLDYLLSHPDEIVPVRQPLAYARDGWYAGDYAVKYSSKPNEYCIALVNLAFQEGN